LIGFARSRDADDLGALAGLDETAIYEDAADFLRTEFDAEIVVERETDDEVGAVPFRPSIDLETG
jgi:leucyl-tRNA synthetase